MPIEFRCPQCQKLLRVGEDAAGKQAKCPGCSTAVTVPQSGIPDSLYDGGPSDPFHAPPIPPRTPSSDNPYAAPLTSGGGSSAFDPANPQASGWGPPWERDGASVSSLLATIKEVFTAPSQFFSTMRQEGGIAKPLLFYFILNVAAVLVSFAVQFGIQGLMAGVVPQQPQGGPNPLAIFAGAGVFFIFIALVMIPISFFIWSAILHVALMIFGGAKGSFETTMRVVAYAGATAAIGLIPFCGSYVQGIANLVFTGIGICYAHRTDGWRAALAVIAPMVCCVGGAIALAVMFIGMAAAGGAGNAGPGFQPQPFDPNQFQIEESWDSLPMQWMPIPWKLDPMGCDPAWMWQASPRRFSEFTANFASFN